MPGWVKAMSEVKIGMIGKKRDMKMRYEIGT